MVVSEDDFPCSSLVVDSFLRLGWAGSAWGLFVGKYEAGKKGPHQVNVFVPKWTIDGVSKKYILHTSDSIDGGMCLAWGLTDEQQLEICAMHHFCTPAFMNSAKRCQPGLKGAARASYVVKSVGRYGTYCGVFAALFSATRCGIRLYRSENDWVNPCIAGAVTGAAFALRSRSYQKILSTSTIVAAIATAADYSTAI